MSEREAAESATEQAATSAAAAGAPPVVAPPVVAPHLLVVTAVDAPPGHIAWPGQPGQAAWAIPVVIPPGTQGYPVFLPLLPPGSPPPTPIPYPAMPPASPTMGPPLVPPPRSAATPPQPAVAGPTPQPAVAGPMPPQPAVAGPMPPQPAVAGPPAPQPARPVPVAPFPGFGPPHAAAPAPSFFQTRWPGPASERGVEVPLAVIAGALGLAIFLPLGSTGIGWLLAGLALVLGVIPAVRRAVAAVPPVERWIRLGWTAAALALLTVLAFRNAWWLVTFSVVGALGCLSLAIVGGRQVRSILFSLVAVPVAAVRGLPWVRRHLRRSPHRAGLGARVAWSVAVTALVLLVFGALLSSADAAFSVVLGDVVPAIGVGQVFSWVFLLAVGGLTAVAAVYTVCAPPDLSAMDAAARRRLRTLEWGLPVGALVVLFGGFVAVQFTVLFGGERHVLQTAGLDYADYARSGFWQLGAVTVLTLAILGGVGRWARRDRALDRVWLRILLGPLCALSTVIVASALSRMYTYQKVYSFTGERIFVMAFELLLGCIFLLVMGAGLRLRGDWIPQMTLGLGVVMLLGLAVLNPEQYAAERNIARYQEAGKIDAWYLRALSADATPALATLPDPARRCTLSWVSSKLADPDPWYAWNLDRSRARRTLDRLGRDAIGGPFDCQSADQFDFPKTR
ncbi:DUF4153 domain-containing protein [Rugosimonospora africana]|uniref:DUF4173 domain-containing protein n=1 Tax=Rugosimonospora africana TaxID=556532 RepID=A0A8J3QVD6_9ACTN|nr:DUF4173 domain-containing protein [Rugosimonospora africana]GIH16732.1 hypothetical protein Raf01_49040 [Rugosimonospora africana]